MASRGASYSKWGKLFQDVLLCICPRLLSRTVRAQLVCTSALQAWPPEEPCACRRQDIGILGVWIRLKLREEDCTVELAERASAKAANLAPTLARPRSSRSTAADFCRSKSIVFFLRTVISSVVAVQIAYKARHRKSGKWPCKSSKIWIDEQRVRAEAWNVIRTSV